MNAQADIQKLCTSSIGGDLTVAEANTLAGVMGVHHCKDGEVISAEGGKASTLYVLIEGQMDVISNIDGEDTVVYTMKQGECAGTRAFVDRSPRKATLRSHGEASVYTLEPDAFESLLDDHPRITYKVMCALFRNTHTNLMRMNQESQQLSNYISKSHGRY